MLYPSYRVVKEVFSDDLDDLERLDIWLLTILLSISSWAMSILLIGLYISNKKDAERLLEVHISDAKLAEQKYYELRYMYKDGLSEELAREKSIDLMETFHGKQWWRKYMCDDPEDHFKADEWRWKTEQMMDENRNHGIFYIC